MERLVGGAGTTTTLPYHSTPFCCDPFGKIMWVMWGAKGYIAERW